MEWPTDFEQRLRQRMAQRPDDSRPHRSRFAPELSYGRHHGPAEFDARRAAVLLLLYPGAQGWMIPLTVRPTHLAQHAGQVSLPGGALEPGESIEQAACRECSEELGTVPHDMEMLGQLSPVYVFASNFLVSPCVAVAPRRPAFRPNPAEVANLLEARLVDLFDPARWGEHRIHRRGIVFRAPHIDCGGARIWGATCVILDELLARLAGPPGG